MKSAGEKYQCNLLCVVAVFDMLPGIAFAARPARVFSIWFDLAEAASFVLVAEGRLRLKPESKG